MKDASHVQWARRLLDDQLDRLSELRNANPRDPAFKLWRQTTLTIIQRIWPGDLARCERFRRVPFSSTSPRQNRAQTREHFERGCAEASAYLKILTLELETQGLHKSGTPVEDLKPAQLPVDPANPPAPLPPDPRDMYEPSPLDRIQAPPPPPQAAAPPPSPAPPPPAAPAPPPPVQASAPPQPPNPPATPPPQKTRKPGRQGLKEMLGFGDDSSRTQSDGPPSFGSPAPPPAFAGEREDVLDPRLEAMLAEAEENAFGTEIPADPEEPLEESAPPDVPVVAPPPAASPSASDLPIQFLAKPQPKAAAPAAAPPVVTPPPPPPPPVAPPAPKPAAPATPAPPKPASRPVVVKASMPSPAPAQAPVSVPAPPAPVPSPTSPTSAALMAIAGQVDRLGVPAAQCTAAREALIDFAKQLDEGIASWDSIREILWIIADYPALARRTIPLLIPHLDLE